VVAEVSRGEKALLVAMLTLLVGLWGAVFVFADWPWV
jgi:hypothetical protein